MKAKNHNLFVNDPQYKMNALLQFNNRLTNNRFTKDTNQRNLLYTRSLIIISCILTLLFNPYASWTLIVLSLVAHIVAYTQIGINISKIKLRAVLTIPCVVYKFIQLKSIKANPLFFNIPSILVDSLFLHSWTAHIVVELAENSVVKFLYFSFVKPEPTLNVLMILKSSIISTVIVGYAERYIKECWVIIDTFRKGYSLYGNLLEANSNSIIVVNSKNEVDYSNHRTSLIEFGTTNTKFKHKLHSKPMFLNAVETAKHTLVTDSIKKAQKGDSSNMNLLLKGIFDSYICHNVKFDKISWKGGNYVALQCVNIEQHQASISSLSTYITAKRDDMYKVYHNLENMYENKPISKKQTNICMAKSIFSIDCAEVRPLLGIS